MSYTSRAATLRRFDLRYGNLGLTAKDLRLIPPGRWAVADLEGISGLRPSLPGLTTLLALVSWTASGLVVPAKDNRGRIRRSSYEMNARKLGIALAIGWVLLPFAACAGAFLAIGDELETVSITSSVLLSFPFIIGTTIYTLIAVKRCILLPRSRIVPRLLLFGPLIAVVGWATVANVTPRRITPDTVSDSPFDKYWYSAPQIAYGTPAPFLRFFDDAMPDPGYPNIGRTLFDTSSFLADVTIWSFLVFVGVSLAYTSLPPRCDGEQNDARKRPSSSPLNGKSITAAP